MKVAFAGARHGHVFSIFVEAQENPLFEIGGAYEENEEARAWASAQGMNFIYNSLEELLNDDSVDAVALGGCFADRGKVAIEALKADKHVIADKPLCTSLAELDEIERLAKERNKKVTCLYSLRFDSRITSVKNLIESGALGEIGNIYFGGQHPLQYGRRPSWYYEEGKYGGVINDIGIHGVDALSFLAGIRNFSVSSARCWNKYAIEQKNFKDSGQFMLEAENGAGILGDISYSVPEGIEFNLPYYWQFHIWGTKGMTSFALRDEKAVYYPAGSSEPKVIDRVSPKAEFMTDFYRLVQGEKDVILPMEDVINSTRRTLEIQSFADNRKPTVF